MRQKTRGNGQGTAYKRGDTWTAQVVVGWRPPAEGKSSQIPVKRTKGGFKTKKEALEFCASLRTASGKPRTRMTMQAVYDAWHDSYAPRIVRATMVCDESACKHFSSLHDTFIDMITPYDLQSCMDACTGGKSTHANMKCVAGLIWHYAIDAGIVEKDVTKYLYIGKHQTEQREPLTEDELRVIREAIPYEPYAEYVYAHCFLGFRPGEFLALKKSDVRREKGITCLVGGSKTEAGRNRLVPVPAAIADIIDRRVSAEGTDLLFPRFLTDRKGAFTGYAEMTHEYFRESVFKPLMARLGIAEGKVPYSARHTYSDKLKRAGGDDRTKAALMGHTDYAFTQSHYQTTDLKDIKAVAKGIK